MSYHIQFQRPAQWEDKPYGRGTIGSSGCGPSAVCNALGYAAIANVPIPAMCRLAEQCGARVSGGTVLDVLLRACMPKYKIVFRTTSKNRELMQHLKSGGTAVCWCGTDYPLYASSSGHFVAAIGVDDIGRVIVADSLWWPEKLYYNAIRRKELRQYKNTVGLTTCNIDALGRATADRAPSYYLISRRPRGIDFPSKKEESEVVTKIPVSINGDAMTMDGITKSGNTYVSLVDMCKTLGLRIDYDSENKTRVINSGQISIAYGDNQAAVSGMIVKGHSYAAVPEIAQLLGFAVRWDADNRTIVLCDTNK